jgi:hypothetical protein
MTKVALRWTSEGKRKRGRPKTTWRRTIENEIKERRYTWGTIERKAKNRAEWRKLGLALCGQNIFIIFLRQVLWKLESLMMSVSVILQHSEPYRSTDSTQLL